MDLMCPRPPARNHLLQIGTVSTVLVGIAVILCFAQESSAQKKGAEVLSELGRIRPSERLDSPANLPTSNAPIQIRVGPHFGWERAFTISNGKAEAVIVPAVGRILQFQFISQPGPFWEDTALRGSKPDPSSGEWINFGGDKTWPAPQSDWGKITPRAWPPPVAFDSMPVEMFVRRDTLVMRSPVDPHYGIQTERVIELDHTAPVMTVTTTYEKVEGEPLTVGVWIITQLEDPLMVCAPLPAESLYPEGYNRQSGPALPLGLTVENGLLSMQRDPQRATKIGTDSSRLLWVGSSQMLLIESPRLSGASYPDQQSSAEIYTNPNPKPYVELEMLGPLHELKPGDRIHQTNRYTLFSRKLSDPGADARRILN